MTFLSDLTPAQGRGSALFRTSLSLAARREPAGRATQDQRSELRSGPRGALALHPHLRPGPAAIPDSRRLLASTTSREVKAGLTAASLPTARRSTPIPTFAPMHRRSSSRLPVAGAEQLRLHVDFGRGQDTGDRVIWANARLYRQQAGKVSALPGTARTERTGVGTRKTGPIAHEKTQHRSTCASLCS